MDTIVKAVEMYRIGAPIMSDNEFDKLAKKLSDENPNIERDTTHRLINVRKTKNSVVLPVPMPSLNKIKTDPESGLKKWFKRHRNTKLKYVVSCKLDGVSGLYSLIGGVVKLHTRGNGERGFDVSHLLSFMNIGKDKWAKRFHRKSFAVRGEFIIPIENFERMARLRNITKSRVNDLSRNIVAGLINTTKGFSEEEMNLVHFVGYEFIDLHHEKLYTIKSSEQLEYISKYAPFPCVHHTMTDTLDVDYLRNILRKWNSAESSYIIDGVVCRIDKGYELTSDNPKIAFAFKDDLELGEITTVNNVSWSVSKDSIMKPVVHFNSVKLSGANVSKCTGFNGAYINSRYIGPGAVIKVKRSGSVIPTIVEVLKRGKFVDLPKKTETVWKWDDSNVEIIFVSSTDPKVNLGKTRSILNHFTKNIGIKGLGPASIEKLIIEKDIITIERLMRVSENDLVEVLGKNGTKVYRNITNVLRGVSIEDMVSGSGFFGRSVGKKVACNIIEKYGNVFSDAEKLTRAKEEATTNRDVSFLANVDKFNIWLIENNLDHIRYGILKEVNEVKEAKETIKGDIPQFLNVLVDDFKNRKDSSRESFVFTGKRIKKWISFLEMNNLRFSNSVNSKTYVLFTNNMKSQSIKMNKARKDKNIRVMLV